MPTGIAYRGGDGILRRCPPRVVNVAPLRAPNLDLLTTANPISVADGQSFMGQPGLGGASTFARTALMVDVGRGKVLNQHHTQGQFAPADGIVVYPLLPKAVDEAYIDYDFRFLSSGTPWGKGGKLPGLGGKLPGQNNPPTGGSHSPGGFSARMMWITPAGGFGSENPLSPVELIGYPYYPTLSADPTKPEYGKNLRTRRTLNVGQWYTVRQHLKMNTVTTEGSSTPPANGIHRIWLDGQLVINQSNVVWRLYLAARITHYMHAIFYGGGDSTYAPAADTDIQIDNMKIWEGAPT